MLRTTVLGIVGCMLAATLALVALAATGVLTICWGVGLWIAIQLAVLYAALRFERIRYKAIDLDAPAGFVATAERFVDPATGVSVQVWFNAATGERRYLKV